MNNYNRGGGGFKSGGNKFGGGGRPRDGKRFGGGGNRPAGSGEMFKATCSDCNKACEVPFRPSGEKSVFCSDCFGRKQSEGNRGDDRRHDNARPRQQFEQRPVRPDAFRGQPDNGLSDIKKQLANLEQKLNRILDIINPPQPAIKSTQPEVDVEVTTTTRAERKQKTTPKKVPSKTEIKTAVAKAMATKEEKVVKKVAKKAPSKKAPVKAVIKKATAKKTKK